MGGRERAEGGGNESRRGRSEEEGGGRVREEGAGGGRREEGIGEGRRERWRMGGSAGGREGDGRRMDWIGGRQNLARRPGSSDIYQNHCVFKRSLS